MAHQKDQTRGAEARALARRQHGVLTRQQLMRLGFSPDAIKHRVKIGRLFPVFRGVYAVGRRELSREGSWMAATLACGDDAALSHESAGSYLEILRTKLIRPIHISVPAVGRRHERPGLVVHRRAAFETCMRGGIRVTTPDCTIIDLAATHGRDDVEAMINEADVKGLTNPEKLRATVDEVAPRPGTGPLRRTLDIRTFRFTRSQLERAFIPIALRAGLPRPLTRQIVNGYEVDFYWPELKLIVETDGLRYHRTPQQRTEDLRRDLKHAATGHLPLRFSHGLIRYEPEEVEAGLRDVAVRLAA